MRVGGILLVEGVVEIDEVDRAERSVFVDLAYDTSDAVAVVRIILREERNSVIADRQQTVRFRDVETDALVHDGIHILGDHRAILRKAVRNAIDREENLGVGPRVTILRGLQHGHRGGYMLIDRVAQIVHIERAAPIGHHRLVVVGPAVAVGRIGQLTVGAHGLDVVDTDDGRQTSVVQVRIREFRSGVVDAILRSDTRRESKCCHKKQAFGENLVHCVSGFFICLF